MLYRCSVCQEPASYECDECSDTICGACVTSSARGYWADYHYCPECWERNKADEDEDL